MSGSSHASLFGEPFQFNKSKQGRDPAMLGFRSYLIFANVERRLEAFAERGLHGGCLEGRREHERSFNLVSRVPVVGHSKMDCPRAEHPKIEEKVTGDGEGAANVTCVDDSTVEDETPTATNEVVTETRSESYVSRKRQAESQIYWSNHRRRKLEGNVLHRMLFEK